MIVVFFSLLGSHPTWKLLETRLINCEHDHKERKTGLRKSPSSLGSFSHHSFNWRKKRKINAFYVPETMMIPRWWCWEMREKSTDQPPPTAAVTLYLKWGVLWTNKNQHFTNKAYPDWGGSGAVQIWPEVLVVVAKYEMRCLTFDSDECCACDFPRVNRLSWIIMFFGI